MMNDSDLRELRHPTYAKLICDTCILAQSELVPRHNWLHPNRGLSDRLHKLFHLLVGTKMKDVTFTSSDKNGQASNQTTDLSWVRTTLQPYYTMELFIPSILIKALFIEPF